MRPWELFALVVFFFTLLAVCMYIVIMGPSRYHRNGIVGRVYRCLLDCPRASCGCCCSIFFGCNYARGRQKWECLENYVVRERNYLMVVFYVLLVWSVEFLYLFFSLPKLEAPLWSKFISWALVLLSEGFYGLAVLSDPGIVTADDARAAQRLAFAWNNTGKAGKGKPHKKKIPLSSQESGQSIGDKKHAGRTFLLSPEAEERQNTKYVVDGILYSISRHNPEKKDSDSSGATQNVRNNGIVCETCHISRPSRSKHCRFCNYCVRRYDHHCPWINNDVAEGTHRWFLLFLVAHAISCTWALWDLWAIMKAFLVQNHLWGWKLRLPDGRVYHITLLDYVSIIVHNETLAVCLFLFALMIGLVLWMFWMYQMSFVFQNLTMNEMNKIDDSVNFIASLPSLREVYHEVKNVRDRLAMVATRRPRRLLQLDEPSPSILQGSQADKMYRKKVRRSLYEDLTGVFDRGVWNNLLEVFFPYN